MNQLKVSFRFRVFPLLVIILELSLRGLCEIYPPIIWTPLNPIFKHSTAVTANNDSVYSMNVLPMSKLYIICPNQVLNPIKVEQSTPKDLLYENLWIVDKKSFDSCKINRTVKSNRQLMGCNDPLKLKYYPLVFQDFSATAQELEFSRDKDYFFIATSNGQKSSLTNTKLGRCHTDNMKIKIHICRSEKDPVCNTTAIPTTLPVKSTTTRKTTTITTTTVPPPSTTVAVPTTTEMETVQSDEHRTKIKPEEKVLPHEPNQGASKGARCEYRPEDTTWLILVAVMAAILAVSLSCNIYILCCKKVSRQSQADDKRSSAAHALLRENSRVDKV